jgi:hypothetical protein
MCRRRSALLAKRPTILFWRLLSATMMALQSTPLSVRWPTMNVSFGRMEALAPP